MTQLLLLGALLGMRHALDPDHVAAVSTLISRGRSLPRAAVAGAAWGAGHTLMLSTVGILTMALGIHLPQRASEGFEFAVGVMLVGLGASAFLTRGSRGRWSLPQPDPGGHHSWRMGLRPLLVGMVHGLAGSAGLLVLVLTGVRDVSAGVLFLLIFGAGSTLVMIVVGMVLALPLALSAGRFPAFERGLAMAAGGVSVALGLAMMSRIVLALTAGSSPL